MEKPNLLSPGGPVNKKQISKKLIKKSREEDREDLNNFKGIEVIRKDGYELIISFISYQFIA